MCSRIVGALVFLAAVQLALSRSAKLELRPGVYDAVLGSGNVRFSAWQSIEDSSDDFSSAGQRNRDFVLGVRRPGSVLVKLEEVISPNQTAIFTAYSTGQITYVAARDQTNGTGGFVRYYTGGIQQGRVTLDFSRLPEASLPIHFVIEVWAYSWSFAVPAADFQLGQLRDHDQFEMAVEFNFPGIPGAPVILEWEVVGSDDSSYTVVETWDMSGNGTGGLMQLIGGGIGQSHIHLSARSSAEGLPLQVAFAIYKVFTVNGGASFRQGRFWPGQLRLADEFIQERAVAGQVVSGRLDYSVPETTIQFIQAWDNVQNGTSRLAAIAGGLGYHNVFMVIESGIGEELNMFISVYGSDDRYIGIE